jgi:major membrane immunogen (membrane-anchored lipoprotein)
MISEKTLYIILGFALIALLAACSSQQDETTTAGTNITTAEKEKLPDQESWESTIIITKDGLRMAEVWAGYIANYNKRNEAILKDSVHVDFYNQDGNHIYCQL